MPEWNLPDLIDHTVLRPDAVQRDILRICQEAREYRFAVIFVPPCYVGEAVAAVEGTAIRVGSPVGFPLGGHMTAIKVAEAVEAEMFTGAERLLERAGYQHYEISNYARPGRQCRHNLTYWRRQPYLGIGAGADSFAATGPYGRRWENARPPAQYMGFVEQRGHAAAATEELGREQAVTEFLFLGLRLLAGVDARRFTALFGSTLEAERPVIGRLVEEDLLECADSGIRLTRTGLLHADSVFAALM